MGDPLFPASKLDGNQVLTHAFDETRQRLRVDAEANVINASIAVDIDSASGDNMAIVDFDGDEMEVNPDGTINTRILDESGNPFTTANPLPVSVEESEGTEVVNFTQTNALTAGASINHDYTVTGGTTFNGDQVFASSTGIIKIEVKVETASGSGVFNTKMVAFNTASVLNAELPFLKRLSAVAGAKVRITITNRSLASQDVCSTLVGVER